LEALLLAEQDLDWRPGSILVWQGKGGRRREVGMDELLAVANPAAAASRRTRTEHARARRVVLGA
jgi:hypothetical protein